jgi:hypothetical protein
MEADTEAILNAIRAYSNVCVPVAFCVAFIVVAIRMVPAWKARLEEATKQSQALGEALPDIKESLAQMARDGGMVPHMLREMNGKLDLILSHHLKGAR